MSEIARAIVLECLWEEYCEAIRGGFGPQISPMPTHFWLQTETLRRRMCAIFGDLISIPAPRPFDLGRI